MGRELGKHFFNPPDVNFSLGGLNFFVFLKKSKTDVTNFFRGLKKHLRGSNVEPKVMPCSSQDRTLRVLR